MKQLGTQTTGQVSELARALLIGKVGDAYVILRMLAVLFQVQECRSKKSHKSGVQT